MILYTVLLIFTCGASYKAEQCTDEGVNFQREYVLEGEPVYMASDLISLVYGDNVTVTWFKNGSQIQISSDPQSRVHEDTNLLKFLPSKQEDAGYYLFEIRNTSHCFKKLQELIVFKNDEGLCYNKTILYPVLQYMTKNAKIVCPSVYGYFDISTTQFKWFKECQPLEIQNNKYLALENTLTITDPDKEDEGNYTCVVHFNYNDVTFSLTRAVDMTLRVLPELRQPLIRNPKNDIVKVELGSPVTLRCEVLNRVDIGMIWYINDTFVDSYYNFDPRIILEDVNTTVSANGEPMLVSNLHFLEVKEEDYNKKFFCVLFVPANPMAYVILQPPDPNLQPFLIAFFVSLVFLAITIVIAMKIFKVDIVLWYRSSCFASKIVKDGKLYDAYVMYPKNVSGPVSQFIEMFVLMVLPEVLERKCAYRLFIFGRDELPGEGISDVINEAISQSRRLIIILGATLPEYHLKDDFEQQIAMYDALIRNKMKVILVELEKISYYKNMPESIRYIKQKQGAVRWKGEFTDKNLSKKTKFWKHLRYYMPQEQHKDLEDMYSNSDNKC